MESRRRPVMPNVRSPAQGRALVRAAGLAMAIAAGGLLGGCLNPPQPHGHVIDPDMLSQVTPGASQEQVQLLLGSPDTTSTIGGQAYYYISQMTKADPVFGNEIKDQRVVAVYFDEHGNVKNLASYGLQDGKVFDFLTRKTVTSGADLTWLGQMLEGLGRGNPVSNWGHI